MLNSAYKEFDKIGAIIDHYASILLGIIVLVMFGSLLLQVISRYFFNSPLSWPEEVTMFLMAWMSFIGASVALRSWGHIGVDFFLQKCSGKKRIFLLLLIRLVALTFTLFLLVEGSLFVMGSAGIVSDGMRIPMVYPRLSMPIGGAIMTLHIITFILGDLHNLQTYKES
ncbi:TRAP transporter small permease [Desulfovibrio cuneatus]|uniref:TRAP transporter small permease n=1 Tax=Desulfovibrio cuneatus TaxID=159728 RepID=UPI0004891E3E|nr:TRAP transporter small permease [Desulfovibrio cuneatus]